MTAIAGTAITDLIVFVMQVFGGNGDMVDHADSNGSAIPIFWQAKCQRFFCALHRDGEDRLLAHQVNRIGAFKMPSRRLSTVCSERQFSIRKFIQRRDVFAAQRHRAKTKYAMHRSAIDILVKRRGRRACAAGYPVGIRDIGN